MRLFTNEILTSIMGIELRSLWDLNSFLTNYVKLHCLICNIFMCIFGNSLIFFQKKESEYIYIYIYIYM